MFNSRSPTLKLRVVCHNRLNTCARTRDALAAYADKTVIERCVKSGNSRFIGCWSEAVRAEDLDKTNNKWLLTWAFDCDISL